MKLIIIFLVSLLIAVSARADISEDTLVKLFGSPYLKIERQGSRITRITFSKFEEQNFHGGECYALILEVLRGSDGTDLGGDKIPGLTVIETNENDIGSPIWKDDRTGSEIHWIGDFQFKVTRNGKTIMTAYLTYDKKAHASRFILTPLIDLPL